MQSFFISTKEGKSFSCNNSDSILEAALKAGLVFDYSCKTGQCGVCKIKVYSGDVIELQEQLALTETDRNENKVLSCCSSPTSDLLIDAEDLTILHDIEIKTYPCRIEKLKRFSEELIEVVLRLPPAVYLKFVEGQYIDVIGPNGIRRSYSIASTSKERELKLLIKRFENGLMSDYWFNKAKENDLLRIEGPKGTFFLRNRNQDLVFLATGTGIAPIISILKSLDDSEDFAQTVKINLFWGNRRPEDFIWEPSFKKIKINKFFVLSRFSENWPHYNGYVQEVATEANLNLSNSVVYACGSNSMIQSAKKTFMALGLKDNNFYSDAFVQSY